MSKSRSKSKQRAPEPVEKPPIQQVTRPRTAWLARQHWQLLALALITVVAFAPAMRGPLLFDDILPIDDNPSIHALWPLSIPLHPPRDQATAGRPVSNISFAINYAINEALGVDQRPDPQGQGKTFTYHAGNLLLHLLCGLLLFGITRRTVLGNRYSVKWSEHSNEVALAVTALWLLHPLTTSAVDYLMARTDVLVSLFYLGTVYASIRAWVAASSQSRAAWFVVGVVSCFLGMGSKELMVSAPLMVICYDRAFRLDSWKQVLTPPQEGRRWFYAGLVASLLVLVLLLAGAPRSTSVGFELGVPWYTYLLSQGRAILHYLWLVVWPMGLTFDYGRHPYSLISSLPGFLILCGLGAGTLLAWRRANQWGWLAFLGSWFFCILAPSSSVVPFAQDIASDRRFYLVLPAALIVLMVAVVAAVQRINAGREAAGQSPLSRTMLQGVTVALLLALAVGTYRRSHLFSSAELIWRDTITKAPSNARAYNNLATVLSSGPQRAEAEPLFRRAAELDSMYPDALLNLAQIELEHGNRAGAEELLQREVRAAPWNGAGLSLLSSLLLDRGDARGTIAILHDVADSMPDAGLLLNLGVAYAGLRRPVEAEAAFRRGLAREPGRVDVMRSLGGLLTQQGRAAEALTLLEQVADAEPFSGLNQAMLAMAYAGLGRDSLAVASATYAVKSPNADARVFVLAGRAMLGVKQASLAEQYLTKGLAGGGAGPDAYNALGKVREQLGMRAAAIDAYQRSLKVNPADSTARARLTALGGLK